MTASPVELLAVTLEAFSNGEPLSAEAQEWLCEGLAGYVQHRVPLNAALGLTKGTRRRYLLRVRDYHLRAAYRHIQDVKALDKRIRRFSCGKWQRWQGKGLGENADAVDVHLYNAFQTRQWIPDERQLRRIVNGCGSVMGKCR